MTGMEQNYHDISVHRCQDDRAHKQKKKKKRKKKKKIAEKDKEGERERESGVIFWYWK